MKRREITDEQIRGLRAAAGLSGDDVLEKICDIALGIPRADAGKWSKRSITQARNECARLIALAEGL
jgi:hypothetical protein